MTDRPKPLSHPTRAYRMRALVAVFGAAGIGLALFGGAASVYHDEVEWLIVLAVALLAQVVLLAPKQNWTTHVATSGRPMGRTLIIASFMFATLSIGLGSIALDALGKWSALTGTSNDFLWHAGVAMAILWLVWGCAFFFLRDWGPRYLRLRRIVHALIAGSLLESIVATGVLAIAPDPDDCICGRGSFFGLFLSGFVALWAFGPAMILVFWERKAQREFVRRRCEACQSRLANSIRAGFDHCRHCNAPLPTAIARQTR